MKNRKMNVYKFTLENGTDSTFKTEGLFASESIDEKSQRVLITSAILIDSFEEDEQGNRVVPVIQGEIVEKSE